MGGVEKAVISTANLLAQRCEVNLFSVYNMPGSPAFSLDERVKLHYLLQEIPNREEWKAAIRDRNPLQFIKESVKSVRILAGKKRAVRTVIESIREGVIICTRHEDNLQLSRYGSKDVLKIAQIHHDHCFDKKLVKGFKQGYGGIDVLAMLTPGLADEVKEMMLGCNDHTQVIYMPNFLEHYPEKAVPAGREKVVIAAGRLNEVKRFDLLIRQFAAVHHKAPDWKLRILGEGEDREALERLIAELGAADYISLPGRKNGEEVEQEMLKAAFFAMSSRSEGFPFVLLEAQSCALPILAYDVRVGPGFMVHDGVDGYLVPEGDEEGYERRMLELMESEELRRRMGEKALSCAAEFSREKIAEMWYSVIGI